MYLTNHPEEKITPHSKPFNLNLRGRKQFTKLISGPRCCKINLLKLFLHVKAAKF